VSRLECRVSREVRMKSKFRTPRSFARPSCLVARLFLTAKPLVGRSYVFPVESLAPIGQVWPQ